MMIREERVAHFAGCTVWHGAIPNARLRAEGAIPQRGEKGKTVTHQEWTRDVTYKTKR